MQLLRPNLDAAERFAVRSNVTDQAVACDDARLIAKVSRNPRGHLILCSESLQVPVAIGVLRPAIVLPAGYGKWSDDRLHIVLLHEIMHIGRYDVLAQSVARIGLAHCFGSIRWLGKRLVVCDWSENSPATIRCCLLVRTPINYADHLLDIAAAIRPPVSRAQQLHLRWQRTPTCTRVFPA